MPRTASRSVWNSKGRTAALRCSISRSQTSIKHVSSPKLTLGAANNESRSFDAGGCAGAREERQQGRGVRSARSSACFGNEEAVRGRRGYPGGDRRGKRGAGNFRALEG